MPTYRERRRWSDRIKDIERPLFPGYVFCRFDGSQQVPIVTTPGVIEVVSFAQKPAPVDAQEIADIQAVVKSRLEVQPWPRLAVGQRVVMGDGPLRGLEGTIMDSGRGIRLVISVTLLQRSVSVGVERNWLVPAEAAELSARGRAVEQSQLPSDEDADEYVMPAALSSRRH